MTTVYTCTCNDYDSLPSITIQLAKNEKRKGKNNTHWFSIPKESYMKRNGTKGCGKMKITPSDSKFGTGDPSDYWIMGDIFLQNYYSIYDYPKSKMGLIEAKDSSDAGATSQEQGTKPPENG